MFQFYEMVLQKLTFSLKSHISESASFSNGAAMNSKLKPFPEALSDTWL